MTAADMEMEGYPVNIGELAMRTARANQTRKIVIKAEKELLAAVKSHLEEAVEKVEAFIQSLNDEAVSLDLE